MFEAQSRRVGRVSTYNRGPLAQNMTEQVLALVHGVGAGRIVTLNIPASPDQRPGGIQNVNEAVRMAALRRAADGFWRRPVDAGLHLI